MRRVQTGKDQTKIILVIDDEELLLDMITEELETYGFAVVKARDGLEGLEKIQSIEPDLIICDRAMPTMTGYELLERIRGVYPQYKSVPFVFLTALTDARDRNAVSKLNPAAYLEKPVDFDLLLKTIDHILFQ